MLFNPTAYFPDDVDVDKAALRQAFFLILTALGELPSSYAEFTTGEAVLLGDDAIGPAAASQGASPITFAGRPAGYVRTDDIALSTALNLTDSQHLGRWLVKTDAASCLITLEPHTDPTVGVLQGFKCVIWQRAGAGSVQVTSSMSNTHQSGHTRIASNGIATLVVDTVLGEWSLHGETSA